MAIEFKITSNKPEDLEQDIPKQIKTFLNAYDLDDLNFMYLVKKLGMVNHSFIEGDIILNNYLIMSIKYEFDGQYYILDKISLMNMCDNPDIPEDGLSKEIIKEYCMLLVKYNFLVSKKTLGNKFISFWDRGEYLKEYYDYIFNEFLCEKILNLFINDQTRYVIDLKGGK